MREWRRLLRRLKDVIHPPRYPEYEEYGHPESAVPGVQAEDDATKMRRVQLVAAFAVIISIGGAAWMYFGESAPRPVAEDPRVREALASQVLANSGVEGVQPPPRDNLDEIKRWAADLERRVERNVDSVPVVVPGATRPSAPYYGQGFDPTIPLALPTPALPYDSYPEVAAYGEPSGSRPAGGLPGASVRAATEPVPASPVPAPAAPTAPPAPEAGVPPDSPAGRYAPSAYEPIDYRPRVLERY